LVPTTATHTSLKGEYICQFLLIWAVVRILAFEDAAPNWIYVGVILF